MATTILEPQHSPVEPPTPTPTPTPHQDEPILHNNFLVEALGANQEVYLSSILANTFEEDLILIRQEEDSEDRQQIRALLVNWYLKLGVNQDIFFGALFYLEEYLKVKPVPQHIQQLVFVCLALSRRYQKSQAACWDVWEERLGYRMGREEMRQLEDEIILALGFSVEPRTRLQYMTALFLVVPLPEKMHHFSSYLLDLSTLLTHNIFQSSSQPGNPYFSECEIGISCIHLTCHFFHPELQHLIPTQSLGFSPQRIDECCSFLFHLVKSSKLPYLKPINRKYRKERYMEVGKIKFTKVKRNDSWRETDDSN